MVHNYATFFFLELFIENLHYIWKYKYKPELRRACVSWCQGFCKAKYTKVATPHSGFLVTPEKNSRNVF